MPEPIADPAVTTPPVGEPAVAEPPGDPKTFDAEYVAKLRQESAKYRTEAKANADAAKRLAEIEESQKSEAQKAADRIAALEKQAIDAQREALRFKVASANDISAEDAELFLTGADEETLTKQATRLKERTSPAAPRPDRSQGGKTNPPGDDDQRDFVRQLFAD
jgi:hypothetical protein